MRKFLLLIALMVSGIGIVSAQNEITIGNGTSSDYNAPFNNYYKHSWNETIYQKGDIGGAGTITSVSYQRASASSYTTQTIKIYMGETTRSSISSDYDWTPSDQLTLVYSGSNVTIGDSEWETFTLNTPFEYSGENNLVVVVAKTASNYTNSLKWYYTNSSNGSNVTMYRQNDSSTSYASHPSGNTGTRLAYAANIKLGGNFSTSEQPLTIGDSKVIDYDGYSLKYTVTSVEPAECEVVANSVSAGSEVKIPSTVDIDGVDVSVTSIGKSAFHSCINLTNVTFQEQSQLTSIEALAFEDCRALTNIEIPNTVTSIGSGAFRYCYKLTNVIFGENSQLTSIEAQTFCECYGLTNINLPNTIVSIGDKAFQNSKIKNIELPSTITYIGSEAFRGCGSLTTLRCFAENVPETGADVFYYVPTNMNIQVPENSINLYQASSPWNNYKITKIYPFFNGDYVVKEYGDYSLRFTAYTSIEGCYVEYETTPSKPVSIVIPSTVKLNDNNIDVTSIGIDAFSDCSMITSIEIPSSIITIKDSAFESCINLANISIGEKSQLTSVGMDAFRECKSLTSIVIPYTITSIQQNAFYGCLNLKDIICYKVIPAELGSYGYVVLSAFGNIHSSAKIYVPYVSLDEYKTKWSAHSSLLVGMPTYTEDGWTSEPTAEDYVAVNAPMVISGTTRANNVLTVNTIGFTENGSLTIKDGGQLIANKVIGEVTVEKEIAGYQQSDSKWYTIAFPLKAPLTITPNSTLLTPYSNYDLYRYDEPTHIWENYKNSANNGFTTLVPGRGYLYANAEDVTLEFTGAVNTEDVTYTLTTDGSELTGFHLIGNPFTQDITFAHLNATENAELVNGYYVLNGDGAWGATLGSSENDVIKVGQAALVKATEAGILAISRQQSAVSRQQSRNGSHLTSHSSLQINVTNGKYSDRAFVVFDNGIGLDKINHENENIPLLYIPVDGTDYAIAMMDMNVNEIPVNFETNVMGEYTISLRQENCEFEELYLLDKETNTTVNILAEDYTFIATSSDNPERFVLIKDNSQQPTDNSHFAYVNNSDIVIQDINGCADIQIFDAMGRCLYNGNCCTDAIHRVPMGGFSTGVYMIQKADESGVKVQKIIL